MKKKFIEDVLHPVLQDSLWTLLLSLKKLDDFVEDGGSTKRDETINNNIKEYCCIHCLLIVRMKLEEMAALNRNWKADFFDTFRDAVSWNIFGFIGLYVITHKHNKEYDKEILPRGWSPQARLTRALLMGKALIVKPQVKVLN